MAEQKAVEQKTLEAVVLGQNGKYVILDVGAADGVQVGDVFDHGETNRFVHPFKKDSNQKPVEYHIRGCDVELYVERVFGDHCLTVMTYSDRMPYFDLAAIKQGKYTVQKGHPHRLTGTAAFVNPAKTN